MKPIVVKKNHVNYEKHLTFGGSSENSFFYDIELTPEPEYDWDASTPGSYNNSSFLAFDSLLIVSDLSGRITAFHIGTGKKQGELKYSGGIEQAPVISNSYIIFIINEAKEKFSTLVVYDLVNSREVHKLELLGKFSNELLMIDDFIYAITDFGKLYKLTTWGTQEWNKDLNVEIHSDPAGDEEFIYLATVGGNLLKIDSEDGSLKKEMKIDDTFQSGITIDAENIYLGGNSGKLYSLNKNTFVKNWEFKSSSRIVHTPSFDNQDIYFGNLQGTVYSVNKISGDNNWNYETYGLVNASPLVFNNILIQPNLQKRADIFDKHSGELLNQLNFDTRCRTTPLYHKNKLFIGIDKGEIFCFSFDKNKLEKE